MQSITPVYLGTTPMSAARAVCAYFKGYVKTAETAPPSKKLPATWVRTNLLYWVYLSYTGSILLKVSLKTMLHAAPGKN